MRGVWTSKGQSQERWLSSRSIQNTSEERKARRSGDLSIPTNALKERSVAEVATVSLILQRREDTCVVSSLASRLLWPGQSKRRQLWNYVSHGDYKDIRQRWQAPAQAALLRWWNGNQEIRVITFPSSSLQTLFTLESGCGGFTEKNQGAEGTEESNGELGGK